MNRRSHREMPSDEHIAKTQDMNGIIHPCCHPEAGPQPESEEAMLVNVGKFLDRLISQIRPRFVRPVLIQILKP